MEISEPSGKLMRWRLRLSEFDFDVQYKKGLCNTQADALSRLDSLGHTVVPLDDEIPVYPNTAKPETCNLITSTNLTSYDISEVTSDLLEEWYYHDELLMTTSQPTPEVFLITSEVIREDQRTDPFCRAMRSRLSRGEGKPVPFIVDDHGTLFRSTKGGYQIVIPQSLQRRVLELTHHSLLTGHPGGRRMYAYLSRFAYWPSMSVDCYTVVKHCEKCARNRVMLRKKQKNLRLFPATAPSESVAIHILGELLETPRGNLLLLVITDRFSKLVRTVPLAKITAQSVAQAFVHHWCLVYGPPIWLLSDNGKQFTAKFFQHVCRLMFTTNYHPQTNGQVERFNRTILAALRSYIGDHPKDWDLYTDFITYSYNTQVHTSTGFPPFELVLARTPPAVPFAPTQSSAEKSPKEFARDWKQWLQFLLSDARRKLVAEQKRYAKHFNKSIKPVGQGYTEGTLVFVRKEYFDSVEKKHKLSPVADGPYPVVSVTDDTVVIDAKGKHERVSRDRVVKFKDPLRKASDVDIHDDYAEKFVPYLNEGTKRQRRSKKPRDATRRVEDDVTPRVEEDTPKEESRAQRASGQSPVEDKHVMLKVVNHGFDDTGHPLFRVRWYDTPPNGDTWEPPGHIPRSQITAYYKRIKITPPATVLDQALTG